MSRVVLVPSSRIPSVATASLGPSLQKGKEWARSLHVSINGGALLLFGWQAFAGMAIVQKLLSSAASPTSLGT